MASISEVMRSGPGGSGFGQTIWTKVGLAKSGDSAAMDELAQRYWYPLYAFLRKKGQNREDAQDHVQGFFAVLLARNQLSDADAARGKFRTFLLTRLQSFVRDRWRADATLKRGNGIPLISMDGMEFEDRYRAEPPDLADPGKLYDRAWAQQLQEQARKALRAKWARAGHGGYFAMLEPVLSGEKTQFGYAHIAQNRGISEGAVRKAAHDLRQAYQRTVHELLRSEFPVPPSAEQEEEVRRDFHRALGA